MKKILVILYAIIFASCMNEMYDKVDLLNIGITIPEGFSPNDDGINDKLVFKGLERYPNSLLCVFSRSGLSVYQDENYQKIIVDNFFF